MNALLLLLVCGTAYLIAYHTYGKFLARRIFALDPDAKVPSTEFEDGIDYVPSSKGIVFGHHFTSIAGTGPIVGPAIGIIWGWLPAILWVVFGCILMGAVHDFGALVVSLRNRGVSISEVAARYINSRVRFVFFAVVFFTVLIVIAIFGVIIASVFTLFPSSVVPVWLQIPIAIGLGHAIRRRGVGVIAATAVAVGAMYLTIGLGSLLPLELQNYLGVPSTGWWVAILLIYAWIASGLPVGTLLQPRDFINAWQLFIAMGLLAAGTAVGSLSADLVMVAPSVNPSTPVNTPALWPAMFVIIACGAISGFHSLVASGTSPKQLRRENDSLFVGYGSMLLEGALAVLVLICVGAGIGLGLSLADGSHLAGTAAWNHYYDTWIGAKGLADKIAPVVEGAANLMALVGIPVAFGVTIMGVFVASFAGTTLDTAVRLQRYVVVELASDLGIAPLSNRWAATSFAVLTAALLAYAQGADGTGAMRLWPLFGSANQLLAALALLVVTIYLRRQAGHKYLVSGVPCIIMLVITNWAMIQNEWIFLGTGNWLLFAVGGLIFLLALWMTAEVAIAFVKDPRLLDSARREEVAA